MPSRLKRDHLAKGETGSGKVLYWSDFIYYVYMIESLVDGDFYKGSTSDYVKRAEDHNRGESKFTRLKMPWKLVFVQIFETKTQALIQERKLKRCNKEYLRQLIKQPINILNHK